jgi:GNAT superfamily N-acetyltransferase
VAPNPSIERVCQPAAHVKRQAAVVDFDVSTVAPQDVPELGDLIARVIATSVAANAPVRAEMTENALSNLRWSVEHPEKCCHLKCTAQGGIVGVVLAKNFWNLCSLFVLPEFHGRGVGRTLVLAAVDHCRGKSERNALWLNAATNAVSFYSKLGFIPRSTSQPLPPGFQAMQLSL